MDMLDWITLALFFALGFWLGSSVTATANRIVFKTLLDELGITQQQLIDLAKKNGMELPSHMQPHADDENLEVINIKLETHKGVIYAFRKDTDEFLGQGEDREALITALTQRLKQARLIISQDDGAALIREKKDLS